MRRIRFTAWAREYGISYATAKRWRKEKRLPVLVEEAPTGRLFVCVESNTKATGVVLYSRVSSSDRKDDLTRQAARLRDFSAARGWSDVREISEVGSGLNGHRNGLMRILKDATVKTVVVEHRDRLARFGVEYIEAALSSCGREIVVLNEAENKLDIVQDFVDVVTSMCARIYGRRSAKNRATAAIAAAEATRVENT